MRTYDHALVELARLAASWHLSHRIGCYKKCASVLHVLAYLFLSPLAQYGCITKRRRARRGLDPGAFVPWTFERFRAWAMAVESYNQHV